MATLDTEIRKLQPVELCTLAQILNQSDSWKKLMAIVPKDSDENQYMFNNEHFTMIEQAVRQQQRSGADIFLSEWSTLNRKRPTCRLMLHLLIKAELFRAADYLAVDILKSDPPERPKSGPAAAIDISEEALEELLKQRVNNLITKCDLSEDIKTSWSLHFSEKPMHVVGDLIERTEKNTNQSDLIKFSMTNEEIVRDLPQEMSDLMKFSNIKIDDESEIGNYFLQEARSEDIPLCVRENAFQSNRITSSVIESSEPSTSVESSNIVQSTIPSEYIILPNVSQNIIPLVVLEYNEKDKNKVDT